MSEEKIKYISLIEASGISKYSPDYLGYLIRKRKLGGKKIGRDWFTTEESLNAYLSSQKFITVENVSAGNLSFHFSIRQKISPKLVLSIFGILLISGFTLLLMRSSTLKESQIGDFENKIELQQKEVFIGEKGNETIQELQRVNVTTYSSDEAGGVEISVQPNSAEENSKKSEAKK